MKKTAVMETTEDLIHVFTFFHGVNEKVVSKNFKGGRIIVIIGGGLLDLREAKIEKEKTVKLEIHAVCSGIKISVPPTWLIQSAFTHISGGYRNATIAPKGKPDATLVLTGKISFGGVIITN